VYGGSAHKQVKVAHFHKAAGGVIRHVLQQLGEIDIIAKKADKPYVPLSAYLSLLASLCLSLALIPLSS
jgi:ribosomal protein S19E (S16A)